MTYCYLATPYSRYAGGLDAAHDLACKAVARFLKAGIPIYSPIVHSHEVSKRGEIDALSHDFWLKADEPMMEAAHTLIVLCAEGWATSHGIQYEVKRFIEATKPVFHVYEVILDDPAEMEVLARELKQ